jgi:hypothetical protein
MLVDRQCSKPPDHLRGRYLRALLLSSEHLIGSIWADCHIKLFLDDPEQFPDKLDRVWCAGMFHGANGACLSVYRPYTWGAGQD